MRARVTRFFAVVVLLLASFGAEAAAEPTPQPLGPHPLVPSERAISAYELYDQGVPSEGGSRASATHASLIREGGDLYATHCVTCHGADLRGSDGGLSLDHAGGAAVDFYLTTGRMPAAARNVQAVHSVPHFTSRQIEAIDAYVSERAADGITIPAVSLDGALLQRGRTLFEENCQACHGAGAEGATAGYGWIALPLYRSTSRQVGEAIRVGPGVMPRFSSRELSARDVDALATYVNALTVEPQRYGGLTMDYLGPTAEGLIGGLLGVGALFWVIFFTGTKADGSRLHERP